MPALVVPQVVRYTVRGQLWGRPWANVWDIKILSGRPAADEAVEQTAEDLLDAYRNNVFSWLAANCTLEDVVWVDLDSEAGSVGHVTDTPTGTYPYGGVKSAQSCTPSVAVLVTKNVTGGRSARRGRCFIAGIQEGDVDGPNLTSGQLSTSQTNFNAFKTTMQTDTGGVVRQLGVVSAPAGQTPVFHALTSLTVNQKLATIRRRLRP